MRFAMHYRNPTIVMQFVMSNLLSLYLTEDNWWIHKWIMLPYLFWFTNSLVLFWYLIANEKICFFWSNLCRFLLLSLCLICIVFQFTMQGWGARQGDVLRRVVPLLWAVCAGMCCCLRFLARAEAIFGQSRAVVVMNCCCHVLLSVGAADVCVRWWQLGEWPTVNLVLVKVHIKVCR